jgi:hypothetical protein
MNKLQLFSILFSLFLIFGCKDEVQTINSLTAVQDENEITLEWTPANVSGFKYYRIMRATDGQNYKTINNVDSIGTDAFQKDVTTYTDTNFPYVDSIYYKVMAFGDEIISSPNVCIYIKKNILTSQNISTAYVLPEEKKILLYTQNWQDSYMSLFDYTTNQLINKVKINITTTGSSIFFGKYNGKHEFYFFDSWNNKIYIYDALTLAQIASINFWSGYPMFSTNNNGTIYSNNGSSYTFIIDRKNLTATSYQGSNYIDKLYYMSYNNKLLGSSYNRVVLYSLDDKGNITAENPKNFNYSSDPIYIENSNLIYWGDYGSRKIINTDNWQENRLTISNNVYKEFSVLYSTKNILYACSNSENKLYCFSMTNFKLIKTVDIRFTPNKFLSDSNYLFFYGNSMVDKIKLVQ